MAAFRAINSNKNKSIPNETPHSDPCVTSNSSNAHTTFSPHQISFLTNTHKAKAAKSEKFRVYRIIDIIQDRFKKCWEHQKSVSSKLSFYHSIKNKFGQECYLNLCKGFSRRCSTTQLRISAHDLEIERGRYTNTPRDKRICTWCKTSMDIEITENEAHVLFNRDLYEKYRSKLIKNLNEAIKVSDDQQQSTIKIDINPSNLRSYVACIISPYHIPLSEPEIQIKIF